ncbi:hypothetical protein GOBAR_AA06395 [Gossypium barbadense]|uniref:Uncharacterized protein n=1 Tax=Gossypium barbadense TaxID=3634 RepID=A0A2P5YF41_GOSBA|nr:hypothetical protein GOBAR_AA06395 [Gossypium barbadense]
MDRGERGSAGRGLYHERSKEVNLFQIYNMDSGNAMELGFHADPNESSFLRRKGYNLSVECHLDVVEVISSSLIIPKLNLTKALISSWSERMINHTGTEARSKLLGSQQWGIFRNGRKLDGTMPCGGRRPTAAVIQRMQALSGMIRRKASVGGFLSPPSNPKAQPWTGGGNQDGRKILPGLDMPRILLKERGAFRNANIGGVWLSSARAQIADDKSEEGEDDVKSSCPLCPGRHTCYNGRDKESRSRESELTRKTRPQFGLQAATRLHEAGIASNICSSTVNIVEAQLKYGFWGWNLWRQPIGFIIFLISSLAECERLPFDLPEAEE